MDQVCTQFELAWKAGDHPRIEDFWGATEEPERSALLRELILIDRDYRRGRGEKCSASDYRARFPDMDLAWLDMEFSAHTISGPEGTELPTPLEGEPGDPTTPFANGPGSEAPLRQFGDYDLLEEIARGGMGVVYKARQRQLNRIVALKMIRDGEFASPAEVRRFRTEAENAVQLDHPHIVPVYQVGEDDGRCYFSMKFQAGGSLANRLATAPPDARQAAALVAKVARAVHYAHERGILHRDLKPANILLDTHDEPHVTDFGLARRLDGRSGLTQSGALVGTPSYMPPEQAAGQAKRLTTAADVYALGAILYELLTGRPPFQGATALETLEQVRSTEPVPLHRWRPKLARDLETICLKCLEKEPGRRYPSAQALAEDLERFLAGEPIQARTASTWERARKWARRRPAIAALSGALLAVAILGLGLVTWQWRQAIAARARADANADAERRAREAAEANLRYALDAVDRYCTRVSEDPQLKERDLSKLRQQLLQTAVDFYQNFVQQRGDREDLRALLGRAFLRLGMLSREIDTAPRAIDSYQQAASIFERLAETEPDNPAYQESWSDSQSGLAAMFHAMGQEAEALPAYRKSLEIREQLAQKRPDDPDVQRRLALGYWELGDYNRTAPLGSLREAEQVYLKMLPIQDRLVREYPAEPVYQAEQLNGLISLGLLYGWEPQIHRVADAEKAFARAIVLGERLTRKYPGEREYWRSYIRARTNRAGMYISFTSGREARAAAIAAESDYQAVLPLIERLIREYPSVTYYHHQLAVAHQNLSYCYQLTERYPEAETHLQKCIHVHEQLVQDHPQAAELRADLGDDYGMFADVLRVQNKLEAALTWYLKGIPLVEESRKQCGTAARYLDDLYPQRADVLSRLGRYAEALQDWDKVLALRYSDKVEFRVGRARTLAYLGRHAEAIAEIQRLSEAKPVKANVLYLQAQAYALTAAAAQRDTSLTTAARVRLGDDLAGHAVTLLDKARAASYFNDSVKRERLQNDPDFAALHGRKDFAALLAQLEKSRVAVP
jgi:tetratricopeptide (TPR) repeat protein/tRNA A-37 threonylcarbamoyl transferase component Bud32